MVLLKATLLFVATALAEIIGCYLPYLWLRQGKSPWLLVPAGLSLCAFVWLLSVQPGAAGRIYAAYGGVYVCVAAFWLWRVDRVAPDGWDFLGLAIVLIGMAVIVLGPHASA